MVKSLTRIVGIFVIGLVLVTSVSSCGEVQNSSTSSDYKDFGNTNITIGIDVNNDPYSYELEKQLMGFDIEFSKSALSTIGITASFKQINWANKEQAINSGEVDLLWSGVILEPALKNLFEVSKPYLNDPKLSRAKAKNSKVVVLAKKGNKALIDRINIALANMYKSQNTSSLSHKLLEADYSISL